MQAILQVRANAYAMLGAAHLTSWAMYNARFLEYYTKDPAEHFRYMSVAEAEESDQQALREIFGLCNLWQCAQSTFPRKSSKQFSDSEMPEQTVPCSESACPGLVNARMAGQSRLSDGSGIVSDGDWFSPKAPDVLQGPTPTVTYWFVIR